MSKSLYAIVFRPAFRDRHLPADAHPRLVGVVNSWLRAFPGSVEDVNLDFEDWVENAIRLHSAIEKFPDLVAVFHRDGAVRYLDGKEVPVGANVVFIGTWIKDDAVLGGGWKQSIFERFNLINNTPDSVCLADNYACLQAFNRYAGRDFALCGFRGDPSDTIDLDIREKLAKMYMSGAREAFVKVNMPKYMVKRIDLLGPDLKDSYEAILANHDLALATVHLEGRNNAFVVQEAARMEHEYRFVVVNHRPVCGAGCIEYFTPLNNESIFDIKTEESRNNGRPVYSSEIIEKYRKLANAFCKELETESPLIYSYTVDVALINGKPGVIEINPLRNYGLYAINYDSIINAEVENAVQRGFN